MSELQILLEFKNSLITFFDELIEQFPEEGDLVIARIFLKDQIPIKEIMDIFIHKINQDDQKIRKYIKDRNEIFFTDDNNFFDSLGREKVNNFKKLWRSGRLDKEDKIVVWRWVDSFVYLADKYAKAISNI